MATEIKGRAPKDETIAALESRIAELEAALDNAHELRKTSENSLAFALRWNANARQLLATYAALQYQVQDFFSPEVLRWANDEIERLKQVWDDKPEDGHPKI